MDQQVTGLDPYRVALAGQASKVWAMTYPGSTETLTERVG